MTSLSKPRSPSHHQLNALVAGFSTDLRAREAKWTALLRQYAVIEIEETSSIWCQGKVRSDKLPRQGWKIHVSATITDAELILAAVGPILVDANVPFKIVRSLRELGRLNCGLFYGYSQIGKFLTAYPSDDDSAGELAKRLAWVTRGLSGPSIPFERKVVEHSIVHARYGLFRQSHQDEDTFLEGPDGTPIPDRRDQNPEWAVPPEELFAPRSSNKPGKLATVFRAYEALVQRGKGGVYKAVDLSVSPARYCIIKEGRRFGELDMTGRDGRTLVAHEATVLCDLGSRGVAVPEVYAQFEEEENWYLVTEWIDGTSLADRLYYDPTPLELDDALKMSIDAAQIVAAVHNAKWVWRDMKPSNLLMVKDCKLRALDFEGAARIGSKLASPWGTLGYAPPENDLSDRASTAQDKYALGAVIYGLFTNKIPQLSTPTPIAELRSDVPQIIQDTVTRLLDADPAHRPSAASVSRNLTRLASRQC